MATLESLEKLAQETHTALVTLTGSVINLSKAIDETKAEVKGIRTDLHKQEQDMTKISTTVYGVPNTNDEGLCGYVSQINEKVSSLQKAQVKIYAVVLAITGAVSGGVSKLVNWLSS